MKIIFFEKKSLFFDFENYEDYEIVHREMFNGREDSYLIRLLRNIPFLTRFSIGDWKKENGTYDYAIIPDRSFNYNILKYIKKNSNKFKKIILIYRNKIQKWNMKCINYAKKNDITVYTYDLDDSKKFELNYNPQVWNKKLIDNLHYTPQIYNDVFFIGTAKDRYNLVIDYKNFFEENNLKTNFIIVSKKGEPLTINHYVEYNDVLNYMISSKAILDVVNDENYGLTIRPLEALFLKKKLITNYGDIKKELFYPYYKEDIYILGEDSRKISKFVREEFKSKSNFIDYYDQYNWIRRFIK